MLLDIILQKSLKEGFGLVVSEALWKGRPMVDGRAGSIPMQFPDVYQDYLVDSIEAGAHPCCITAASVVTSILDKEK